MKLKLSEFVDKKEVISAWDEVRSITFRDGTGEVFRLRDNSTLLLDTIGLINDGEFTDKLDDYLVLDYKIGQSNMDVTIIKEEDYYRTRDIVSQYDDMSIVLFDDKYYQELEDSTVELVLIAKTNAPYHDEGAHLSGTFEFDESNITIYFDVSAEGDRDGLYYYFITKE